MKKLLLAVLVGVTLSAFVGSALAGGHSSRGGRGGHGGGGHAKYSFSFGFGNYRPRPYYSPPRYYRYPVVIERPVVVERSVVITQPAPVIYTPPVERLVDGRVKTTEIVSNPTVTIWIANDNGSQTPVELRPQGTGFVGPSNEYYATMPTQEQLKAAYGLKSNVPAVDTVVVWLNNSDGTKTSVTLTKDGSQYIGPKGEYYPNMPTEEQLKLIYGK